ncbi:MAG: hypothetical protein QM802_03165 [Agriterribacter sp.]
MYYNMDHFSIVSDFATEASPRYYKQLALPENKRYTAHSGGNFVYISNDKNLTVRFISNEKIDTAVSEEILQRWINAINTKLPGF